MSVEGFSGGGDAADYGSGAGFGSPDFGGGYGGDTVSAASISDYGRVAGSGFATAAAFSTGSPVAFGAAVSSVIANAPSFANVTMDVVGQMPAGSQAFLDAGYGLYGADAASYGTSADFGSGGSYDPYGYYAYNGGGGGGSET